MLEGSQTILEDISKVFRKHFSFSEEDIKKYIDKIVAQNDDELVLELGVIFEKFTEFKIEHLSLKEKRALGKSVVANTLNLYIEKNAKVADEFFAMAKEAEKYEINPYRLAIETNMVKPSVKKFEQSLLALVQHEYELNDEKFTIYEIEEVKELFENCSSIACKLNSQNIQNVLDVLSDFLYDKESGKFVLSPVDVVKKANSLLTMSPKTLEKNIEFLKDTFVPPMTEVELASRVALSPTMLNLSPEKHKNFEDELVINIQSVIDKNGLEVEYDFSRKMARTITTDIEKLTQIIRVKPENIERVRNVLVKRLGPQNAISCMTDFNFLSMNSDVLDCILCKLAVADQKDNSDLRGTLIEKSASILGLKSEIETIKSSKESVATGKKISIKKKKANRMEFADVSEDVADSAYRMLTKTQKDQVNSILNNLKDLSEKAENEFEVPDFEEKEGYIFVQILERIQETYDYNYGKGYSEQHFRTETVKKLYEKYRKINEIDLTNEVKEITQVADKMNESLFKIGMFTDESEKGKTIFNREVKNCDGLMKDWFYKMQNALQKLDDVKSGVKYMNLNKTLNLNSKNPTLEFIGKTYTGALYFNEYLSNLQSKIAGEHPEVVDEIISEDLLEASQLECIPEERYFVYVNKIYDIMLKNAYMLQNRMENFEVHDDDSMENAQDKLIKKYVKFHESMEEKIEFGLSSFVDFDIRSSEYGMFFVDRRGSQGFYFPRTSFNADEKLELKPLKEKEANREYLEMSIGELKDIQFSEKIEQEIVDRQKI